MRTRVAVLSLALGLAAAPDARAQTTIMDQIGSSGAFFTGATIYLSQRFTDDPTRTVASVDNFNAPTAFTVTNVSAALLATNGSTSYNTVTGYEVNIYSSLAAANASVNGDVFHGVLTPTQVALTRPFSGDANSALASLPVSFLLPHAGAFYVSVLADLASGIGGVIGVYGRNGRPGATPGDQNGYLENPGGGFGLPGNQQAGNADFAYRISGVAVASAVPEPATYVLMVAGLGVFGLVAAGRRTTSRRGTAA